MNQLNTALFYLISFYPVVGLIVLVSGSLKPTHIMGFLAFSVFSVNLIYNRFSAFRNFLSNLIFLPVYLYLYLIFAIYDCVMDFNLGKVNEYPSLLIYFLSNRYLYAFYIFYIIEYTVIRRKDMDFICKVLKITVVVTVLVSIIQSLFDPKFLMIFNRENDYLQVVVDKKRSPSIFGWIGAMALAFNLPPILSVIYSYEKHNARRKGESWFYMIAGGISIFLSQWRFAMLSYLIVLFQKVHSRKHFFINMLKVLLAIPAGLLLTYFTLHFFDVDVDGFIEDRIMSGTASSRLLAFEIFSKFFFQNMWFGTGGVLEDEVVKELAGRSSQIHVGFLSLFYYYGIIGGGVFCLFAFFLLRKLWKVARLTGCYGSFYAVLTLIIANSTQVYFYFFEMGIIIALVYNKFLEQKIIEANFNRED